MDPYSPINALGSLNAPVGASPLGATTLTAEEVLLIADEVCEQFHTRISNIAAIPVLAAALDPAIAGISVFPATKEAKQKSAEFLTTTAMQLQPLEAHNDVLAAILLCVQQRMLQSGLQ